MNGIANLTGGAQLAALQTQLPGSTQAVQQPTTEEAFQDFVAGTFYKLMLKEMRKSQGKPAYFHGGQAEDVFQSQMDQQVAEDLAHSQGAVFAEPLFQVFSSQLSLDNSPAS